ncbi:hypothetical protein GCM10010123_25390 [Pilimelia anulata]|uniref:Ricin B lectin domain-containing protein n=1 Tax=Pilimelia anulata TaxID=53371 RepID=A0A8J3F8U1_9ACTN|nr:RICIN domain-containing protein [Pilimelia anulata]GGJ94444.1 hypothetical protein GCM10010123_25390 [Pilimelia anulata]
MSFIRYGRVLLGVVLPVALAIPLTATGAAAAAVPNRDIINKTSGGRLATLNDSTADGAQAITLRDPAWRYRTEVWDVEDLGEVGLSGNWLYVLRNQAANKCLQPAAANPARGANVVIKTCDGSELQKWLLKPERISSTTTGWWSYRPRTADGLALTLRRYNDGSWDTLYLDTAYPSSDRLWRTVPNDTAVD